MIALGPLALQGLVLLIDEFYCHRRRPLRRWERLGHPLDTLIFALALLWLLTHVPGARSLRVYIALGAFSCLEITKDEWQHRTLSTGFENWLHALLFILHPVVLAGFGWLWWTGSPDFAIAMRVGLSLSAALFSWQLGYWNFWRRD